LGPNTRRLTTAMTNASGAPTPRKEAFTTLLCCCWRALVSKIHRQHHARTPGRRTVVQARRGGLQTRTGLPAVRAPRRQFSVAPKLEAGRPALLSREERPEATTGRAFLQAAFAGITAVCEKYRTGQLSDTVRITTSTDVIALHKDKGEKFVRPKASLVTKTVMSAGAFRHLRSSFLSKSFALCNTELTGQGNVAYEPTHIAQCIYVGRKMQHLLLMEFVPRFHVARTIDSLVTCCVF
jgi:hypothetical protein